MHAEVSTNQHATSKMPASRGQSGYLGCLELRHSICVVVEVQEKL
jgi:hypothetical protein